MNNKYIFGVVGLVVGLVAGYFLLGGSRNLGAPTADQSLNQQRLLTELTAMFTDASAIRTSVNATVYSQAYTLVGLGALTQTTSSVTVAVNATTTAGDFLAVSFATTSVPYVQVSVMPLTTTTVAVTFRNASTTSLAALGVSSTIYVWDIPQASAFQPAALTQ